MNVCNTVVFAALQERDSAHFVPGGRANFDERLRPMAQALRCISGVVPVFAASGCTVQEDHMTDPDYYPGRPESESKFELAAQENWNITFVINEDAKDLPAFINQVLDEEFNEMDLYKRSIELTSTKATLCVDGVKHAHGLWILQGFVKDGYETFTNLLWDVLTRRLQEYVGEVVYETTSEQ